MSITDKIHKHVQALKDIGIVVGSLDVDFELYLKLLDETGGQFIFPHEPKDIMDNWKKGHLGTLFSIPVNRKDRHLGKWAPDGYLMTSPEIDRLKEKFGLQ